MSWRRSSIFFIPQTIMLSILSRNTSCKGVAALVGRSLRPSTRLIPFASAVRGSLDCFGPIHKCFYAHLARYPYAQQGRFFSSDGSNDEDSDEEEEEPLSTERPVKLEAPLFKDYDINYLRDLEERGELQLQPFYQRGFKWTQKQASLWIESILRGYPCLPEITLLSTIDEDGAEKYAVFDGQQRLTSIMLYISNTRSKTWPTRKANDSFRLEQLPIMKDYDGKRYQDLPVQQQNEIKKFPVRCAIIPASWSMSDYIDFFKRLQGGGTPMSDHELRRALSQGPFTDLLDKLSRDERVTLALNGCKKLKTDDAQQLLLRYFQYRVDSARFGKPTLAQNGLETMKHLNREMKGWMGDEFYKQDDLILPLKKSLELILHVFHQNEPFRRPVPLFKGGEVIAKDAINRVWFDQDKLREPLWDCTVATFAREDILKEEKAIRRHAGAIRNELISIMQSHPAFTDTLRSSEISTRVHLFATAVLSIVQESAKPNSGAIPPQQRKELIQSAIESNIPCGICNQPLSPYPDHLHIDHKHPRSKGGTNDLKNLQVVHKTCNLIKSNKIS